LIPILYEDAQNKTLETPCQTRKLFYAASHKFGMTYLIFLHHTANAPIKIVQLRDGALSDMSIDKN
jgi:hypothetical protein